MGRKKKSAADGFHLDLTQRFSVCVSDVLNHGLDRDVRHYLWLIGALLGRGEALEEPYRTYLVDALNKIAMGQDANKAFGLGRVGPGPHEVRAMMELAGQLRSQGMSSADAWSILSRLTPNGSALGPDMGGGPALKKKTERAYKTMFGKLPGQK